MSSLRHTYAVTALSHTSMFVFASVIALLFSFSISIPSALAETITVSTADELMTALENAQGGETIELAPGSMASCLSVRSTETHGPLSPAR